MDTIYLLTRQSAAVACPHLATYQSHSINPLRRNRILIGRDKVHVITLKQRVCNEKLLLRDQINQQLL